PAIDVVEVESVGCYSSLSKSNSPANHARKPPLYLSGAMPIQHRADQARQPHRQHVEHAVIPAGGFIGCRDERIFSQVVFDIFDFLLPGAPAEFEPSQTL